jgi:hypothetical protein
MEAVTYGRKIVRFAVKWDNLTRKGISPNAASVFGREHGRFNPARERGAREQKRAGPEPVVGVGLVGLGNTV